MKRGYGAPTTSTIGEVGEKYIDLSTGTVYKCVEVIPTERDLGFVSMYELYDAKFTWVKDAGGVSSWNDLTDKPFYEETGMVEILPETALCMSDDGGYLYVPANVPQLIAGKKYVVTVSGTSYVCAGKTTTLEGTTAVYLGNGVMVEEEETSEPFIIVNGTDAGYDTIRVFGAIIKRGEMISITTEDTIIHPLEGKYLPKGTPWIEEDVAGAEILPEITVMLNEDGIGEADVVVPLISGEKYIVTWNGTKYVCEAMEGMTSSDSDTLGMMTDEFVFVAFVHEKFVLSSYDSTLTEVTVSINQCVTNIGKIDGRCLSDGTPYVQENTLLGETEATSTTHPTFGQMWRVRSNTPKLIVGKTYVVTYNDTAYKCVCQAAPAGLTSDPNAVAMGNFAPVGGTDTGEPFAMLVSHAYQEVNIIDLANSTAVKVKISEITAASETYLSSPNGTIFKITVSDDGTLSAVAAE